MNYKETKKNSEDLEGVQWTWNMLNHIERRKTKLLTQHIRNVCFFLIESTCYSIIRWSFRVSRCIFVCLSFTARTTITKKINRSKISSYDLFTITLETWLDPSTAKHLFDLNVSNTDPSVEILYYIADSSTNDAIAFHWTFFSRRIRTVQHHLFWNDAVWPLEIEVLVDEIVVSVVDQRDY